MRSPLPRLTLTALAVLAALSLQTAAAAEAAKLRVGTSILPHKHFIERIGGDRVHVEVLVLPGQNPHSYEPRPKQIADLTKCKVYFTIGMPFEEQLLPRIKDNSAEMKVMDLQQGIKMREFTKAEFEAHEASHADDHGHAHGTKASKKGGHDHHHDHGHHAHAAEAEDPHTWLNPRLAKTQAKTILEALVDAAPADKEVFQAGYKALVADLDALDTELKTSLAPLKGKSLLVYHPAFGYFADAYGLKQVAVETGGKEPSAKQLANIVKMAQAENVKVVFVQPQFSQASARAVANQIGGVVMPLDDLAEDYLANLRTMAQKVRENVKQ